MNQLNVSIASDKASVRGLSLQNSILVAPASDAIVLCPQACLGASSHLTDQHLAPVIGFIFLAPLGVYPPPPPGLVYSGSGVCSWCIACPSVFYYTLRSLFPILVYTPLARCIPSLLVYTVSPCFYYTPRAVGGIHQDRVGIHQDRGCTPSVFGPCRFRRRDWPRRGAALCVGLGAQLPPCATLRVASAFAPIDEVTQDRPQEVVAKAQEDRAHDFLKRKNSSSVVGRPQQRQRRGAASYIRTLDNQAPLGYLAVRLGFWPVLWTKF